MSQRVRSHVNPLNYRFDKSQFDSLIPLVRENKQPLDLEIGFGKGIFIRNRALNYPHHLVLGVDVRKPVIDNFKNTPYPKNIYVIYATAESLLEHVIPNHCINNVFLFHPDPWPKKRHIKRRFIQKETLDTLHKKLKAKGLIRISTDVDYLYEDIKEKIREHPSFEIKNNDTFWKKDYLSHWNTFSENTNRQCFRLTAQSLHPTILSL